NRSRDGGEGMHEMSAVEDHASPRRSCSSAKLCDSRDRRVTAYLDFRREGAGRMAGPPQKTRHAAQMGQANHAFCRPPNEAAALIPRRLPRRPRTPAKTTLFCRPPNEAAALIPRKLPRRPGTLAKTTLFASRMSWLRALTPRKLPAAIFANKSVQLDLHVHARGKLQLHEGVHGLVG